MFKASEVELSVHEKQTKGRNGILATIWFKLGDLEEAIVGKQNGIFFGSMS